MMIGIICCSCSISVISVLQFALKEWRKDFNKIQEKNESQLECYTYLRNIQVLLSDGKTPYERRFGKPVKGPIIPFGSLVEYHPITAKDQSRIHQFGKKVLPGLFLGYALYAGGFGRVTYWSQTLRSWRRWTHRKSTQTRLNAKEVIFPKQGEFIFPIADGRIKTLGGDQDLRTSTLVRHRPIQGESNIDFLGESEGSLLQPQDSIPDAGEAMNDFWSMSGNFIYRHHVEPRVKLYSPREESFPIPLKYIDVSRTTHTNLDVKQEKQCRLGLFQDSDFAGDLEDSKSTSGGTLCTFGSQTFVPISWVCKKQTAVSHSSTESEIISLDTGLRLDGLPALELWDLTVSVFGSVSQISDRSGQPDSDVKKHHKSQRRIDVMKDKKLCSMCLKTTKQ